MASQALASMVTDGSAAPVSPSVLVVDDDSNAIAHCSAMLDQLGYRHFCASTSREALELVGRDTSIQVVLAEMQLPSMDGLLLIKEARARASETRPVAAIMMARDPSAEQAIRGMHVEAVDLLAKPIDFEAYSAALRRALRYLAARRGAADSASLSGFGDQISRLVSALELGGRDNRAEGAPNDQTIVATLRTIIASRALRSRFFPSDLFADPAWDILLDLSRAKLQGELVSVSSVCIAASVPMSTALRWVRQMTEAGLLRRWTDPKDRRRDLIALTEPTAAHMRDYLTAAHASFVKLA